MEEGADDVRSAAEATQGEVDALFEGPQIRRALSGEGVVFQPGPRPSQLRRVLGDTPKTL